MKLCPNCKKANNNSAKFCRFCGTDLSNVAPQGQNDDEGMVKCPHCGKMNAKGAKFCRFCGTTLVAPQKPQASEPKADSDMVKCPHCGKLNNKAAKFCRFCGATLHTANDNPSSVSSAQPEGPEASAPKSAEPKANFNYKVCPNCGTKNSKAVKFCIKCGYNFDTKSMPEEQPTQSTQPAQPGQPMQQTRPDYRQQWQNANQSMAQAKTYSMNYFNWLKDTLLHPLSNNQGGPYYGVVSFAIMALFLWIAEVLSEGSSAAMNQISSLANGDLPLKIYINNFGNTETGLGFFVMSIISVLIYVFAGYISSCVASNNSNNILSFSNRFASLTNVNMIIAALMIFFSAMDLAMPLWILSDIFMILFNLAIIVVTVKDHKTTNGMLSSVYVAALAILCADAIQPLIAAFLGIMMG